MHRCLSLLLAVALAMPAWAAPPRDFQRTLADTVIQVHVVKVGATLENLWIGDPEDQKRYLTIEAPLAAGQRIAFSVFERGEYRVGLWGGGDSLAVRKAEPLDEPAGQGFRLTYADGTVIEVIA